MRYDINYFLYKSLLFVFKPIPARDDTLHKNVFRYKTKKRRKKFSWGRQRSPELTREYCTLNIGQKTMVESFLSMRQI